MLKDKVSQTVFVFNKVGTDQNLADALTKRVDANAVQYLLEGVRVELRSDMHHLASEVENDEGGAEIKMSDEE